MKNILLFVIIFVLVKYSVSLSEIVSSELISDCITNNVDIRFLGGDFKGLFFVDTSKTFNTETVRVFYDKSEGKLSLDLVYNDSSYIYFITLSDKERRLLLSSINKYKRWNKIAINNETEVNKAINNFNITSIFWRLQNQNSGYLTGDIGMHIKFFSQTKDRHQLVIYFDEARSDRNKFITVSVPTLYLDYDEILKLGRLLETSCIDQALEAEIERKKTIDNLFN